MRGCRTKLRSMRKALTDVEYDMQLGDDLILGYEYQMEHGLVVDEGTLVLLWPALMLALKLNCSSPLARAAAPLARTDA